uniref:Solute carrier family 7 member 11 n=1 Tax=Pseudonaja textilis TaxID=8673 RepID=A0A670YEM6_PSETE
LTVVTVCYVLTNVSYYAVLTPQEILSSDAVAVSFTDKVFKNISPAILILVALSCFGALNGGIFAASRMLFAAAREGQWPALFSMIHLERHTPVPALILMLPLVYLMVSIGDLYGLLNFYSFSRWFFIGLTTLGFMIHCFRHPTILRPFKVPLFFPLVFTVACFFIVGTSLYSDPVNTSIGCALTLSGLPVYYLVVQKTRIPGSTGSTEVDRTGRNPPLGIGSGCLQNRLHTISSASLNQSGSENIYRLHQSILTGGI